MSQMLNILKLPEIRSQWSFAAGQLLQPIEYYRDLPVLSAVWNIEGAATFSGPHGGLCSNGAGSFIVRLKRPIWLTVGEKLTITFKEQPAPEFRVHLQDTRTGAVQQIRYLSNGALLPGSASGWWLWLEFPSRASDNVNISHAELHFGLRQNVTIVETRFPIVAKMTCGTHISTEQRTFVGRLIKSGKLLLWADEPDNSNLCSWNNMKVLLEGPSLPVPSLPYNSIIGVLRDSLLTKLRLLQVSADSFHLHLRVCSALRFEDVGNLDTRHSAQYQHILSF
jgi:hypothetical protein